MKKLSHLAATSLVCLALVVATSMICSGWYLDPWHMVPARQESYLVWNNSSTRMFLYHDRTGTKYCWDPGQSGYLGQNGTRLKYYPGELRCESSDPGMRCVMRVVSFEHQPGLALESVHCQPARYVRQGVSNFQNDKPKPSQSEPRYIQSSSAGDPCDIVRTYLEKMVNAYYRSRGTDRERRLAELRTVYDVQLRPILPKEIRSELERYEATCQCIHDLKNKGMDLKAIYSEKRCGDLSTKEMRSRIVARLRELTR